MKKKKSKLRCSTMTTKKGKTYVYCTTVKGTVLKDKPYDYRDRTEINKRRDEELLRLSGYKIPVPPRVT